MRNPTAKKGCNLDHEANSLPESKQIRDANRSDISEIVRVHQIAFQGFFLDRMGPAFLRAYYHAIFDYEGAVLLVHCDGKGEIDGFAAGFLGPDRFYAHFRRHRIQMLPAIALALLRRPNLIFEIRRNAGRVARAAELNVAAAELASIGTSRRGSGVGSCLLRAFCERSAALGADKVQLTTDRDDNGAVVRFYLDHGFEQRGVEFRGERALHSLVRQSNV
jgi:ribosomal protein S18 acetylase RimI-like enzyme